jgi:hypothetical protein
MGGQAETEGEGSLALRGRHIRRHRPQILADSQQIVAQNHQPNDEKGQGSHYTINSG